MYVNNLITSRINKIKKIYWGISSIVPIVISIDISNFYATRLLRKKLKKVGDELQTEDGLMSYPLIDGRPVLTPDPITCQK